MSLEFIDFKRHHFSPDRNPIVTVGQALTFGFMPISQGSRGGGG